jgi:DNA (cytosine-5)-methyltransferase 1
MTLVSLFSGAGGLDLGFINAGFDVVWANDNFRDAVETYRRNIGEHIVCSPIESIPSLEIPNADGVIGGFPCQGFSIANRTRRVDDTRNGMYLEFVRIINDKNPAFFIAENVKGILTLGGGAVFDKVKSDFESAGQAGYRIKAQLLNAADYGVPQRRQRVILFGIRKDIKVESAAFPPVPTHARPGDLMISQHPWVSIGTALEHVPEPESNHDLLNHSGTKYKLRFNGHLGHRMVDPDMPAPTITARGDERGGVVIIHHPSNIRRLTVREAAIVQSFPMDYEFVGSNTSAYRQIANAVPPKFAEAIAVSVRNTFREVSF